MNPGDVERIVITPFGYWRAEIVHTTLGTATGVETIGKGSADVWTRLTKAGFGSFDGPVRLRIAHATEPMITSYATGADATAHRGQPVDDPEIVAAIMRWYVDQVLPRRTPGMRTNWTKDVTR